MQPQRALARWGWAPGGVAFVVAMALLAAIFDLGPFKDAELARGELIARGDEICREAHEAFLDLQRRPPGTAGDAAELTARLADIAAGEGEELRTLNGPPEFSTEIDAYVAARAEGIEALRAGEEAAEARDSEAYAAQQEELADSQRERHRMARRIGFAVCSRPLKADR